MQNYTSKFKTFPLLVVLLTFAFCLLSLSRPVSAHIPGQPAFFKVNNVYSNFYNVPSTSLSNFVLPQDQAPGVYLVGDKIDFQIDIGRLGVPPDAVRKIKYTWDYGDGTKGEGSSTNHIYKKMGTYVLTVHADDGQAPTSQLLESAAVNIVPDKNYKLPKAILYANGETSNDPLKDVLKLSFDQSLNFDGSQSTGDIVSYFWDFGDQQSASGKSQTHKPTLSSNMIFPLLQVKDKNGFISTAYVQINNTPGQTSKTAASAKPNSLVLLSAVGGFAIIIILLVYFVGRG